MLSDLERNRVWLQSELDAGKSQRERNRLGQFPTPTRLARDIVAHALALFPDGEAVRFLEPGFGTGSFYSALREILPPARVDVAQGIEIDEHYQRPAAEFWKGVGLRLSLEDFTRLIPQPRFNLVLCNPPYVRHHHLRVEDKARLRLAAMSASGMMLAGLSGLYCYFLGIAHGWLEPGAISGWLIPSEFMDVNYGSAVKRYLLERVTLLHIHRFDPTDAQFADALVSSAVVWFRNTSPAADHMVRFSYGGSLAEPQVSRMVQTSDLAGEAKWTRFPQAGAREATSGPVLSDFFNIKRGVATGDNDYFILTEEEIAALQLPMECFTPVLPSPRYLHSDVVEADERGIPCLDRRLFLLDARLPEVVIRDRYPTLWTYLQVGRARGLHERYLCRHRALWYRQESRPPAPIVCTYLGRSDTRTGRPFRFILNQSRATVANVYLALYPTPRLASFATGDSGLIRRMWEALSRIAPSDLLGEGRVYGGGLHKLEPKELANLPVPSLARLMPPSGWPVLQRDLFATNAAD